MHEQVAHMEAEGKKSTLNNDKIQFLPVTKEIKKKTKRRVQMKGLLFQ